jgi:hypothetical protein
MRFVFIDVDGREVAVDGTAQARAVVAEGRLGPDTMVRTEDRGPWRPAREALPLEQLLDPSQRAAARLLNPRRTMGRGRYAASPKAALRVIGRVFMLLGLAGLLIAAGIALWTWQSFSSMTATEGTVVELQMKWGNSTAVRPVVQFQAQDGQTYTYTSPVNSSVPMFAVGDKVTIYYDPADPTDAMLAHWTAWFFALLPAGMGAIFFLVGLGLRLGGRERQAPPSATPSAVERRR